MEGSSLFVCAEDTRLGSLSVTTLHLHECLNLTSPHLHECQQQLAEVAGGVALYVLVQVLLEHWEIKFQQVSIEQIQQISKGASDVWEPLAAAPDKRPLYTHSPCRPSWCLPSLQCCVSITSQSAFPHRSLNPERDVFIFLDFQSTVLQPKSRHRYIRWPGEGSIPLLLNLLFSSSSSFTLMDPLISEASYWVVLFISPRITVSREPDSAPFRAEIMSWKHSRRRRQHGLRRSEPRGARVDATASPSLPSSHTQKQSPASERRSAWSGHRWWSVHPHLWAQRGKQTSGSHVSPHIVLQNEKKKDLDITKISQLKSWADGSRLCKYGHPSNQKS